MISVIFLVEKNKYLCEILTSIAIDIKQGKTIDKKTREKIAINILEYAKIRNILDRIKQDKDNM